MGEGGRRPIAGISAPVPIEAPRAPNVPASAAAAGRARAMQDRDSTWLPFKAIKAIKRISIELEVTSRRKRKLETHKGSRSTVPRAAAWLGYSLKPAGILPELVPAQTARCVACACACVLAAVVQVHVIVRHMQRDARQAQRSVLTYHGLPPVSALQPTSLSFWYALAKSL